MRKGHIEVANISLLLIQVPRPIEHHVLQLGIDAIIQPVGKPAHAQCRQLGRCRQPDLGWSARQRTLLWAPTPLTCMESVSFLLQL